MVWREIPGAGYWGEEAVRDFVNCRIVIMYNPFPLLSEALLKDQVAKGKRFFVRQTFARGMDARLRAAFLLRAYPSDENDQAQRHVAAIPRDANVFLSYAHNPEH